MYEPGQNELGGSSMLKNDFEKVYVIAVLSTLFHDISHLSSHLKMRLRIVFPWRI